MRVTKALRIQEKRAATSVLALVVAIWPAAPLLAQTRPNVPSAVSSGQVPVSVPSSVSSSPFSVQFVKQTIPPDAKRRWALIRRVKIDGDFPELQNQTAALIAGVQGHRVTLADAFQFAANVQQAYGAAGYPLVNAVLEPQFFAEGEIRIRIIDGFIENLDLAGVPPDLRKLVHDRLDPLIGRRHITLAEIQRQVLLIGELPGVSGGTNTRLGTQFGGVVLAVQANETPMIYGAGVNNLLTRDYGTFLFSQGFSINNTLGLGESIHAEMASTDDFGQFFDGKAKTQAFSFGGLLPIGPDGFTTSANYSQSRVSPDTFVLPGEGLHGTLQQASVRANYPLLLSQQQTIRAQLGFDFVDNREDLSPVPAFVFHDQYEDVRAAGEWSVNFPWSWGGKAISALIYDHGIGGIDGNVVPLSRPGASPDFNKLYGEVRLHQPLPENFVFAALARGQTSFGQSLMNSEELQLAGPDVLSGFGLGTIYVDSGAVGRAELQRPIPIALNGAAGVATPYIFGAYGAGRFEQVFMGENPDVHANSFGGGVRADADFANWPFHESLALEAARVQSNVPFARDGYVGTFIYQMKYGGDPFAGHASGTPWLALVSDPETRRADFTSSGWYGGLNTGYAIDASPKISSIGTVVSVPISPFAAAAAANAANLTGSAPSSFGSPIGGAQIGYNFAPGGPWLLGAEADIDGAGAAALTTSSRQTTAVVSSGPTETLTTTFQDSKSVDWLATLRGRAGVMANPDLLAYFTGGLAVGGVNADTHTMQSWADLMGGNGLLATTPPSEAYGAYTNTLVGWTLGGGVEWMFAPGLSVKGEYLFYDLGSGHFPSGSLTTTLLGTPAYIVASNSSAHFDGHIIRVGLNYHFGMDGGRIVKGPQDDDPPEPAWNGFYAGLNAGGAWGFANSGANNNAFITSMDFDNFFSSDLRTPSMDGVMGQSNSAPGGFIGGGQLGYNLQLNRGLVGVEADMQGTGARGHASNMTNIPVNFGALSTDTNNTTSIDWIGTLRGRMGVFVQPAFLVYATGGLAYGETNSNTAITQQWSGTTFGDFPRTTQAFGSLDSMMIGWTVGGGFEWRFSPNLSLKAEYLLYDLGHVEYTSSPLVTGFLGAPPPNNLTNSVVPVTSVHYDGQIARVGLNYYFSP